MIELIGNNDPYFYLYIRPCHPQYRVDAGNWPAAGKIIRMFYGAALRNADDGAGLEVVGCCDKSKVRGLYRNHLPWVSFQIQNYQIPRSDTLWAGSANSWHTRSLFNIFTKKAFNGDWDNFDARELDVTQRKIAYFRNRIEEFERAGNVHFVPALQRNLEIFEREEKAILNQMTIRKINHAIERNVGE